MKTPDQIARVVACFIVTLLCHPRDLQAAAGHLDPSFDPGTGAADKVYVVRAQSDGKFVIGGLFTSYNGQTRNRVARINSDGSLDASFDVGVGSSDLVQAILILPDGSMLVGGKFTSFNGSSSNRRLVKLNSTGGQDTAFGSGGVGMGNGQVESLVRLSSGKILVMGSFTSYNGATVRRMVLLDSDGNADATFTANLGSGPNNTVQDALELANGQIVIVGNFTSVDGNTYGRIARLNADGTLDTTFSNPVATGTVNAIALQTIAGTEYLVVAGAFARVGSPAHLSVRLARLHADGMPDTSFNNAAVNSDVYLLDVQPDNKLVIGGVFSSVDGVGRNRVARLDEDGNLDATFDPGTGANGAVRAFDLDTAGDWVFGGDFTLYDGTARNRIMRVGNDLDLPATIASHPADQVVAEGTTVQFTVVASGEGPLSYQWHKDGVALTDGGDISGATTATLTIANAEEADEDTDASAYHVSVQANNSAAAVTSDNATLTVNGNLPPTVDAVAQLNLLEDAGAQTVTLTGISEGAAYETSQTLTITATSDNPSVAPNPTVNFIEDAATGSLDFTPVADAFGTANITVTLRDNATANHTTTIQFAVVIAAVNDRPTIGNLPASRTVNEDAATIISAVTVGDVDDTTVDVTLVVANGDLTLTGDTSNLSFTDADGTDGSLAFSGSPANITAALAASIQYQGDADYHGNDTLTLTVADGEPLSAVASASFTVVSVNDAPSFTLSQNALEHLNENPGAQQVNDFATFSPGPDNESSQLIVAYTLSVDNPGLFAAGPTIGNNGRLNYTPAADTSGSAVITVSVRDNGGTENGGIDTSATQTFSIAVGQVNNPPVFTVSSGVVNVDEDAAAQTVAAFLTGIDDGDATETQVVSFALANDNTGLFSVAPAISADGTLTYTLAANQNGTANVTITATDDGPAVGGSQPSSTDTFQIVAAPVNDSPSVANLPAAHNVNEDETLTISGVAVDDIDNATLTVTVAAGNGVVALSGDTTGLTLTDNDGSDGTIIFSGTLVNINSALAASIQYTGNPDANGDDTLTVSLNDGQPENNTAQIQTTISVAAVNDAPSFAKGADQSIDEDSGAQTVNGWATAISAGPGETQNLTFNVLAADPSLFATPPAIDATTGDLTFTPAADSNESTIVTVSLSDDGSGVAPNDNQSDDQTFTITINPINDAPSFTKGADPSVNEDAGAQTVSGWATAISAGPDDETQTLTFNVAAADPTLFETQPAIDPVTGNLTFNPAADKNGSTTVTVSLSDDGSGVAPNDNQSDDQIFTVTINAVNDAPTLVQVPETAEVNEESVLTISGITVGDVDSDPVQVTINSPNATVALTGDTSALTISDGDGSDGTIVFSGSPADVTTVLAASIQFTGDTDFVGVETMTITVADLDAGDPKTASDTIAITVNNVNDAPSVTVGADIVLNEEATYSAGAGFATFTDPKDNPANNLVAYTVNNDNAGLFSTPPAIDNNGNLTFVLAVNAIGVATVSVSAQDDGGTDNGGANTSPIVQFTITVDNVNDEPSVAVGADIVLNEEQTYSSGAGFATFTDPNDAPANNLVAYTVNNNNAGLFSTPPAIDNNGDLTFVLAVDATGVATVSVSAQDDGGTANGGDPISQTVQFTITVNNVNDEPTVTLGADIVMNEDETFSAGANYAIFEDPRDDPANGPLAYNVSADNAGLFATQPAIDVNGNLTFVLAPDASGSATVTVTVQDDGGVLNGGDDLSRNYAVAKAVKVWQGPWAYAKYVCSQREIDSPDSDRFH